jgi:uncharacterized RDD family membrane protein YckC
MEEKDSILENIKTEEVEVTYPQRFLTNIIDGVIEVAMMVALYFLVPGEFIFSLLEISAGTKYVVAFIIIFAYRLICILLSGKTIGMFICRSKYLNSKLLPLSLKERLISVFVTKPMGIRYFKA